MDGGDSRKLRMLVLEDSEADFLLIRRHLSQHGIDANLRRVAVIGDLTLAFTEEWDLVLSDYNMPGMDFAASLNTLRGRWPDTPIILVSGSVGEERAVDLLHQGVTDFVLKDHMARLVPVIHRALEEVAERRARRAAETELRQQEENARAEQARHTEALKAAVDRLTEMNIEMERLTVVAAHELREPLRAIISFSQLLEKRCAAKLEAEEREYISYLVTGANRMNDLIGGLLNYSRVATLAEDTHRVSTTAAADLALENLALPIEECGAHIVVGAMPDVIGHETLVMQVFQNLIANALKFRAPDRPLDIEINAHRDGNHWIFAIIDNGIGFDPAEQDVFELFRQLSPHEHRRGVGAGLAICKRIVHKLDGDIWAEATPGQGASFFFRLPAA